MSAPLSLSNESITRKILKVQLSIVTIVLVATSVGFLANNISIFRRSVLRNLQSTSNILGRSIAPTLSFLDHAEAGKVLSSLDAEPSIIGALVLDKDGKDFAHHGQAIDPNNLSILRKPGTDNYLFQGRHLILLMKVEQGTDIVGDLIVKADLWVVAREFYGYVWIIAGLFSASLLLAYFLSKAMQRTLSKPIIDLAQTAKEISSTGNYSIRINEKNMSSWPSEIHDLAQEFNVMFQQIESRDLQIQGAHDALEQKIQERTSELKNAQKAALEHAHAAGMAEMAIGVLHNIGNLMNTVNISVEEIDRILQRSSIPGLQKAHLLIRENQNQLGSFLTNDPKGAVLPSYLLQVGDRLSQEHVSIQEEVLELQKKVSLIKDVIHTQQEYAKAGLHVESISLQSVLDEVLDIQRSALIRHEVRIQKTIGEIPFVKVPKVKIANILMNLIKNAKEAMKETPSDHRILTIELNKDIDNIYLKVKDTGHGISKETLGKICNHGFTTKKTGHGFGLHFCANAMTELGGKLVIESDGENMGASFTLLFPKTIENYGETNA